MWSSKRDRYEICQLESLAWGSKMDRPEISQLKSLAWSRKKGQVGDLSAEDLGVEQ